MVRPPNRRTVLRHVYADADVPVVQLSIDESQPTSFHFEIGRKFASLPGPQFSHVRLGKAHARSRFEAEAKEMTLAGEYKPVID